MNFSEQLKYTWTYNASAVKRLIFINLGLFVLAVLARFVGFLMDMPPIENGYTTNPILEKLVLYSSPQSLLFRPWTLITYMFMHGGFMHILFNMLLLFFIGRIAEDFFQSTDIYKIYLLGGLIGAILFVVSYNVFPVFTRFSDIPVSLVGASGAVLALVVATAIVVPYYEIYLFGVFRIQLKWLAIIMVAFDLIFFSDGNQGGRIAHLGGAAMGLIYARNMKWFKWDLSKLKNPFKTSKSGIDERKVFRGTAQVRGRTIKPHQDEVDAILDKIFQSGYDSLSREEKEILFRASEKEGG
jgi:membrane associated rhomboid family serine protease